MRQGKALERTEGRAGGRVCPGAFCAAAGLYFGAGGAGGGLYERLARSQQENGAARTAAGYLTTGCGRPTGRARCAWRRGPQGPALVLAEAPEEGGLRAAHLSLRGMARGGLRPAGSAFAPEQAQLVAQSSRFEPEFAAPGLLRIETGQGAALIALRSGEGRRAA